MKSFLSKISKLYFRFLPYLLSFLIALILGPFLYCLSFYIHEGGHIAYGFFDNLISKGIIAKFEISNWIECPILKIIKLPQQTRIIDGYTSLNYALGGTILTILIFSVVSYYFFKYSKNKYKIMVFLFPVLFTIHEIIGNFLCGTDNMIRGPYQFCITFQLTKYIKPIPYLLIIPFFILLIPYIRSVLDRYLNLIKKIKKNH